MVWLADVVAQVESGGRLDAFRFEPEVWQKLKDQDDHGGGQYAHLILDWEEKHGCSPDSARVLLASSWGKFQIMGVNLPGLGWSGTIWAFLTSGSAQEEAFGEFCKGIGVTEEELGDASWLEDFIRAKSFAAKYNGPGSPAEYATKLQEALKALGGE